MSKSLGNYIGIDEPANEMFGKLMSISDSLMWRYFELLSFRPLAEVAALQQSVGEGRNPRDVKFELGVELVDRFHGVGAGNRARDEFVARFRDGAIPDEISTVELTVDAQGVKLAAVLKEVQLVASTSAAYRMLDQNAVRVDGERISDRELLLKPGAQYLLQVGKRGFARVSLQIKS
jgi:tyrosyl-tRNA synthetase